MKILNSIASTSFVEAELRASQAFAGYASAYAHVSTGHAMTSTKGRPDFGATLPVGDTAWFCNQIAKKDHSQQRERST